MKLAISIMQKMFCKYLFNRNFLEEYNAENLQDFAQAQLDFEFLLDDCDQNVNAYGNPDLGLHRALGGTKKCFDSQTLLDPFEKDFYLSATFVKLCNRQSRQCKVVC